MTKNAPRPSDLPGGRREWVSRGRRFSAWTIQDANGKTITTLLLGALRVQHELVARGSLAAKFHYGRGWGMGSMGLCFWWKPWFVAFSHNERPADQTRRILRDRAREDQSNAAQQAAR